MNFPKIMKEKNSGKYFSVDIVNGEIKKSASFENLEDAKKELKKMSRNKWARMKHAALTDLGLKRVRGAQGGIYYE